jgi:hypothetical protein
MNLSPTARSIATAVLAALGAIAVALPTLGAPVWVAVILGAILVAGGSLGLVPPQTGGTQVGLSSPTIVEPPAADVVEADDRLF